MNKKDIANIRKEFKLDNYRMNIREIFNVYVKKESGEIYHQVCQPFQMLEQETQELFLANFKKVLTGHLDAKLFELKFRRDEDYTTQTILFEGIQAESEDWQDNMIDIVGKMFAHAVYEFDTVVTFIRGEYRKPTKKRNQESEEGGDDEVYANPFILCSLNKTDLPKKALLFDYIEKEYKSYHMVDPIINLDSPMSGFLFPAFNDNAADVNHILYCAGKVNQPDYTFIEKVLDCEDIFTAQDDKDCFGFILKEVIGDEVDSKVISNVYEEIDRVVQESQEKEESEVPTIDHRDIERILKVSGVENVEAAKVEHAFKSVVTDEKHEFKATSLVPKSIKIETKIADVTINPKELKNVKYITYEGKRCLLLEVDEEVVVEGFRLESQTLFNGN
ncbi:DUF4317 domain-containing protein [Neobacillus mesonae]|uniref:DUF4317 domain-containing protein n=1 Tax=Neobacillus mesonae TaxID=1193713 RepID=A0A3T0HZ72_9BACI|nr:DUF4317 domain-containing protein [Neobacillus mesonae]AZU62317.1 DUF4317 domain-containing protein [Neobacillus mesonae]